MQQYVSTFIIVYHNATLEREIYTSCATRECRHLNVQQAELYGSYHDYIAVAMITNDYHHVDVVPP